MMKRNAKAVYTGKTLPGWLEQNQIYEIAINEYSVTTNVDGTQIVRTYDCSEMLYAEWHLLNGESKCTCCGRNSADFWYIFIPEGLLGKQVHYLCPACYSIHRRDAQEKPFGPPEEKRCTFCEDIVGYFLNEDGSFEETYFRRCYDDTHGVDARTGHSKVKWGNYRYSVYLLADRASSAKARDLIIKYLLDKKTGFQAIADKYDSWIGMLAKVQ